jgi:uncharacterized membrane protein
MKTGTKSTVIILATLLLGFAIGILASGALARQRVRRLAEMRTRPGFSSRVEEVIQPTDDAQRAAIREVLEAAGLRNHEIYSRTRQELQASLEQMREQLEPLLTEEQLKRLQRLGRGGGSFAPPGGERRMRAPGAGRGPGGRPGGRPGADSIAPDSTP